MRPAAIMPSTFSRCRDRLLAFESAASFCVIKRQHGVVSGAEQRTVLRRFVPEDRDGFVEMNRDPSVRKYFPGLLTSEESLGEMTRIEQHWDTHGFGPWALDV